MSATSRSVPSRLAPFLLPLLAITVVAVVSLEGDSDTTRAPAASSSWRVVAWNDLGMHCIDPDFSVFSILPPFNTLNAHVLHNGAIVSNPAGLTVTFEGVADVSASINTTSIGKTNFWSHVAELFGVSPPLDVGLSGTAMPGVANTPQPFAFDAAMEWFQAEGIPITPLDDALQKNPYPLMRIVVRDAQGAALASTTTVVPNSQELECSACHASGASPDAEPAEGWVFDANPLRDDRLNILRLHDERHLGEAVYTQALQTSGYAATGLYDTVVTNGTSVLCAACHGSNALPGTGIAGISPLTQAMHGGHASARLADGRTLDGVTTRESCFLCHPGQETQCLRGAMGTAIGADGRHQMSCQSCHGGMSAVGDPNRIGWFDQPSCQNCHVGTATNNPGQIRLTDVFDSQGNLQVPTTDTFATEPDVPGAGFSLYRFSQGHGGLQCSACHGPPHAIYPTRFANDNVQNELLQGHSGTLVDCSVCHDQLEDDEYEGPHGMHPVDHEWTTNDHKDAAQENLALCQSCHGQDLRGTVLSRTLGDRTYVTSQYGTKNFWRGFRVSCFACHDGPSDSDPVSNAAPLVADLTRSTPGDVPLTVTLAGTDADADPLSFRIVSQPDHGTVAFTGVTATWLPEPGFVGTTSFTYAAWDGATNSNLGTVTVNVQAPLCAGTLEAYGFPYPGSGGFLPQLGVTGCPEPGGTLTLTLGDALGGAPAVVAVGVGRATTPTPFGCILRIGGPVVLTPVFALSGSGDGGGSISFDVTLPAALPAVDVNLQAFILDPGAVQGLAATGGVEIEIR